LAEAGVVAGGAPAWEEAAAGIRARVLRDHVDTRGALTLHDGGGGPDAALAQAVTLGFLGAGDPRAAATLDSIAATLGHAGLVDRYQGRPDGIDDPCLPFL